MKKKYPTIPGKLPASLLAITLSLVLAFSCTDQDHDTDAGTRTPIIISSDLAVAGTATQTPWTRTDTEDQNQFFQTDDVLMVKATPKTPPGGSDTYYYYNFSAGSNGKPGEWIFDDVKSPNPLYLENVTDANGPTHDFSAYFGSDVDVQSSEESLHQADMVQGELFLDGRILKATTAKPLMHLKTKLSITLTKGNNWGEEDFEEFFGEDRAYITTRIYDGSDKITPLTTWDDEGNKVTYTAIIDPEELPSTPGYYKIMGIYYGTGTEPKHTLSINLTEDMLKTVQFDVDFKGKNITGKNLIVSVPYNLSTGIDAGGIEFTVGDWEEGGSPAGTGKIPGVMEKERLLKWVADGATGDFELEADIDISDVTWVPIGASYETRFAGTFDGGGNTIKGLRVDVDMGCAGLFGYIGGNGVVKNLHVDGASVVGGYAGIIAGENGGTIAACSVSGTVNGNVSGGIAGSAPSTGKIAGCYSLASWVKGGDRHTGGISGMEYNITGCYWLKTPDTPNSASGAGNGTNCGYFYTPADFSSQLVQNMNAALTSYVSTGFEWLYLAGDYPVLVKK